MAIVKLVDFTTRVVILLGDFMEGVFVGDAQLDQSQRIIHLVHDGNGRLNGLVDQQAVSMSRLG